MLKKIVIIGPAWPLRGGLATFDQRLANEFTHQGYDCSIYSFSLQYPAFLFPGTTQFSSDPAPQGITIHPVINSINPLNWISTGRKLKKLRPDIIIVRFWLPFMGPALGTILRRVAKNNHTKLIAITDNVIPHEKRFGDQLFTKYFLNSCHAFITMSEKVLTDLRTFQPNAPAIQVRHPLYDNFGDAVSKIEARQYLGLDENRNILLFFGFIRKYKGLDLLLEAMKILKENTGSSTPPLLLVAGEFYEEEGPYLEKIRQLNIGDLLVLRTNFIADREVKYYLCAADVVIQPYRNATQSGVTPLAYHFEKPMIVTNVGNLPAMVPQGKVGLVAEPEPASIAAAITQYLELGENYFIPHLRNEKNKYGWNKLLESILKLADDIQK